MSDMPANSPLASFLYLLMRDHVPTGVVAELANRVLHSEDEPIHFTAPELGALAYRYADRIQPSPEETEEEQSAGAEAWLARAPERVLEELDRAEGGLDLVELAAAVGWDIAKQDDMTECGKIVQSLYDRGAVQRDSGTQPVKVLITADGQMLLSQVRESGATI